MQPHSEVPTTTTKASATTTNSVSPKTTTTPTGAAAAASSSAAANDDSNIKNQSPSLCKLVKGRRPLINFNFYLDIKDHQTSKKVEERITELGGSLDFFLTKSVTHFITDRTLPAAPSGSKNQQQQQGSNSSNGHCLNSVSSGVGVTGGGVGGGGGGGGVGSGIGYPITPSPYIQSPQTPTTPKTPYTNQTYSGDSATDGVGIGSSHSRIKGASTNNNNNTPTNHTKKISRADAMLHRALQGQQPSQYLVNQAPLAAATAAEEDNRPNLEQGTYRIWSLEYAIRFLKKVTADVRQFTKKTQHPPTKGECEPIQLKGNFIKIETISGNNRPYYSVFRNIEWPKIQLGVQGSAFRLTPRKGHSTQSAKDKPLKTNAMTRKSRSSSKHNPNHMRLKAKQAPKQAIEKPAAVVDNKSEKQCGVCEICKIEYDTLTIHLKTKDHEFFARNQNNYLALDSLIKSSASVDKFLEETSKDELKDDEEEEAESVVEPMEIEEESTRPTRKSSRKQTPTPPPVAATKNKTKPKEVEVVTDKKQSYINSRKSTKSNVPLDSPPIRHPLPISTIYKVVADSKAQTDPVSPSKSSIIVKFRKIRQTELSTLNGEAENFMFPRRPTSSDRATDSDRQTSTDSNRISSSSISSESHALEETPVVHQLGSATAKRRKTIAADSSHKSSTTTTTTTMTSVCYQSFPNTPIQPNKTSQATNEDPEFRHNATPKSPTATQRKRRNVSSGRGNGRGRRGASRLSRNQRPRRYHSEDRMGEKGIPNYAEEEEEEDEDEHIKVERKSIQSQNQNQSKGSPPKTPKKRKVSKLIPTIDISQGRIKDQTYAFERLPIKELWYEVFRRQDACQERMFEYWGNTSYRKLPYEIGAIPMRSMSSCKICTPHQMVEVRKEQLTKPTIKRVEKLKKAKKGRPCKNKSKTPEPSSDSNTPKFSKTPHNKHLNKATFLSYDLMPRKSPREHASTLAILSCLIKQRKDSEIDESPAADEPPTPREETPEKRKTPSPVVMSGPRIDSPEPLQFVSEISENVKRLRRGQRKYEDFIPTTQLSPNSKKAKPKKPKSGGLEFEVDEKRLKSLEAKQTSSVQLEHEIDAYLGRISMKGLRQTPTLPITESSSSSGFVDDFTSDIDLIDLIDCYDGGGRAGGGGDDINSNDQPLLKPAINNVYNLFSAHNRRRKINKANKTGWPTTRRRNAASTRQNHLLQKRERFRFFCDDQTLQKNQGLQDGLAPTTTSMTPPDTDLDDKDDCTRSSVPDEDVSIICKDDILNNSCMSPSEKADNSDIFTVSSDGLDTDLDVSCNQIIKTEDIDDECTTSSTLAAPPATPEPEPELEPEIKAVTPPPLVCKAKLTPAMSSIIKKEVKVSCKRLRTPFRRYRQRR